jgi:hypothetical protein
MSLCSSLLECKSTSTILYSNDDLCVQEPLLVLAKLQLTIMFYFYFYAATPSASCLGHDAL